MAADSAEAEALSKMVYAMQSMNAPESRLRGLNFECRNGDVVVSTPPKSGTTLVQQVRAQPSAGSAKLRPPERDSAANSSCACTPHLDVQLLRADRAELTHEREYGL